MKYIRLEIHNIIVIDRLCVCVWDQRLPLFLEAQSMLGQWGSVSLTSPSGACLQPAPPHCALCVHVCVSSRQSPSGSDCP